MHYCHRGCSPDRWRECCWLAIPGNNRQTHTQACMKINKWQDIRTQKPQQHASWSVWGQCAVIAFLLPHFAHDSMNIFSPFICDSCNQKRNKHNITIYTINMFQTNSHMHNSDHNLAVWPSRFACQVSAVCQLLQVLLLMPTGQDLQDSGITAGFSCPLTTLTIYLDVFSDHKNVKNVQGITLCF